MEPTLRDGDRVVVVWGAAARSGRLAVVRLPDSPTGPRPMAVKRTTRRVEDGWWVERDNPAEGVDSWQVGAVPAADVLGLVLFRLPPQARVAWPGGRE